MANTFRVLLLTLISSCLLVACENELEVAAEWEDVTVVYGVLSASSDTNYIRIQHAYLDRMAGALEFTDEYDSLYYDTLEVFLTEVLNGVEGNTYSLQEVDANSIGIKKDSGLFHSQKHVLYMHTEPIGRSNSANKYRYRLTVLNPRNGNVVRSEVASLGWAEIDAPITPQTDGLVITADSNFKTIAAYKEGVNARAYDMSMVIRVLETDLDDPSKKEIIEMTWPLFKNKKTRSLRGLEDVVHIVPGKAFFNLLENNLDSTRNVSRRLLDFDLMLTGIGDDLYTYLDVNEPSIGIVQKKPEFTNIENGYGILSSSYTNLLEGKSFHELTHLAVKQSDKTAHLGFE